VHKCVLVSSGGDHKDVGVELLVADRRDSELGTPPAAAHLQDERPPARHRVVSPRRHGVLAPGASDPDGVHHDVAVLRACGRPRAGRALSRPVALRAAVGHADVLDPAQAVRIRALLAAEGFRRAVGAGCSEFARNGLREAS